MPLEDKNTTKIVEAIRVISCIFPATLLKTLRTHVDPHVIDILDLPVIILNLLNLSTPSKNLTVVFPTLFFTKQVYHHLLLKTAFLTWSVEQLVIFVPLVSFPLYYAIQAFFFSFFFFFLFKHIYHCFPQKHLSLTRVVTILQIYPRFIQVQTQTGTDARPVKGQSYNLLEVCGKRIDRVFALRVGRDSEFRMRGSKNKQT